MKKDRFEDVQRQHEIRDRANYSLAVLGADLYRRFGSFLKIPRIKEYRKGRANGNGALLRRFKRWTKIGDGEELKVLRRYASTGMVEFRFNCRARQSEAKLTDQGKWFVGAADWSR